uniref:Sm protein B n=1 Tax=Leptocylindrus danicus TaxID=163516 RepID=A0A7S2NYN1_9STRA|mmetsp:Transcript_17291/g.25738  ORF Transcript_17291/g.25738 Transcript_17291/m.25738 type:complete len:125 (+) Transcript_17291:471-845(+)
MAFDKHLNLVLSDTEEYRNLSAKSNLTNVVEERQEKRLLGLIILRGENVVSIAVEGPPPNDGAKRAKLMMPGGPGVSKGVGRGMPPPSMMGGAPMGLGPGAVPGVGGGQFAMSMGRGMPPPPPR